MTLWPTSLQQKIRGVVYILSLFSLLFSGLTFNTAWQNYQQARDLEEFNQTAAHLSAALKGLTFERGRMHVVLVAAPISLEDQQFIRKQREMADGNLRAAISSLNATHLAMGSELAEGLALLNKLRETADSQAQRPFNDRDTGIARDWLNQTTEFINQVETILHNAIEVENRKYVLELQGRANWMFGAAVGQLGFCLLLIVFVIRYVNRRIFQPLQAIIYSLEQIRRGEAAQLPTGPHHNDEMNQLAQGVGLLQATMAEERRLKAENERLALTDFLTGCLNKRAFYLQAEAELSRAAREKTSICFVFADLDNLKRINDSYGHIVGDEAVKHFVLCVVGQCRPYDLIGRFGGDEFVFCFPRADEQQTMAIVNRMRCALENTGFSVNDMQPKISLYASFGIATTSAGEMHEVEWYIHQADLALYRAKQSGKNCVMLRTDRASDGSKTVGQGPDGGG